VFLCYIRTNQVRINEKAHILGKLLFIQELSFRAFD